MSPKLKELLSFAKERLPLWAYVLFLAILWLGMYLLTIQNIYVGGAGEYLDSRLLLDSVTALAGHP